MATLLRVSLISALVALALPAVASAARRALTTLGRTVKHLTLEARATSFSFRVPANAKKGKQKLRFELTGTDGSTVAKSVSVKVI